MNLWRKVAAATALSCAIAVGLPVGAAAQAKPEGDMRYAVYVTISPAWFDPGEAVPGTGTPFWFLYALHDALVKPMPGKPMAPGLAESWKESPDHLSYDFALRPGLKFHNGDPFTAEDVKFSFERSKAAVLKAHVKEVVVVDPTHVRFVMKEPWPDFMTYYGTLASAAGWIVPKNYTEKVGKEAFRQHPVGLGPYKFVSNNPGVELVLEAYDGYWGDKPTVKRLIFKSVPEATTRVAMLRRGEVDVAYLLDASLAQAVKQDPKLHVAFSGGLGTYYLDFFDMWDPKSPWHDERVRKAASLALDRKAISDAETLGASKPTGGVVIKGFEFAVPIEPDPYDPKEAKKLLAEAGYPNGFDAGDFYPWPPYFTTGEAIASYLGAIGIKTRIRTMERAAFYAALPTKKLHGVCMCIAASAGNASTRLAPILPTGAEFAYGGWPDVDELWKKQLEETDQPKRAALLKEIQQIIHQRTRFAPIYDYFWASGIGPRVADPALMHIDPYPWSAPYQEVRLKAP